MMQLSRELRKQGWGQKKDADGDSDSSDLLITGITGSGPTPTRAQEERQNCCSVLKLSGWK